MWKTLFVDNSIEYNPDEFYNTRIWFGGEYLYTHATEKEAHIEAYWRVFYKLHPDKLKEIRREIDELYNNCPLIRELDSL